MRWFMIAPQKIKNYVDDHIIRVRVGFMIGKGSFTGNAFAAHYKGEGTVSFIKIKGE